jgi:pimeloyl-ACP methyl ester carboxylesterase
VTPITHAAVRYLFLGPAAGPATVHFCEEMICACGPKARTGCGRTLAQLDLAQAAESLAKPTLVIAGELDRLTPPVHARRLVERLPDCAGYVELDRVGHMAPLEAPEAIAAEIRGLASGVPHRTGAATSKTI